MNSHTAPTLDRIIEGLPQRYPGPGGALAVLKDGEVLEAHTWGFADVEARLPFTPQTMMLICSISKQFTCSLLLDLFPDPSILDADVARALPELGDDVPGILALCHNQSGLRDYWAQAMLCGAAVEGRFGPAEASRLIGRARTLQFPPGTRYSYANQNFRLISEILESRTGRPFAELLQERLFARIGMPRAELNADTSSVKGGTIGYEGSLASGFRPAVNRIHWTGDAGIAASLEDMIAWERFIDRTRLDPEGLYRRLAAPLTFQNGAPAFYGFGLGQMTLGRAAVTGHGGGLRGWRSFRFYAASERISIVVLFNHMADPRAAALELFAAMMDEPARDNPATHPDAAMAGRYLDPQTGLAVRVELACAGSARLHYASSPEPLQAGPQGDLLGGQTRLAQTPEGLVMDRPRENVHGQILVPCTGPPKRDIEGQYHCAELEATLTCVEAGGALYGAFSGDLGEGAMQPLVHFGADVWLLPCPRALDYEAPGDWTLRFLRNEKGRPAQVEVGCWLARGLPFLRRNP
jgi:D-aminopeptidase